MEQQMRDLIEAAKYYMKISGSAESGLDEDCVFMNAISAAESALEHSGSEYAGNLLAVIHGDGGHYIDKHGWKKATDDAIAKWYAQRERSEHWNIDTDKIIAFVKSAFGPSNPVLIANTLEEFGIPLPKSEA